MFFESILPKIPDQMTKSQSCKCLFPPQQKLHSWEKRKVVLLVDKKLFDKSRLILSKSTGQVAGGSWVPSHTRISLKSMWQFPRPNIFTFENDNSNSIFSKVRFLNAHRLRYFFFSEILRILSTCFPLSKALISTSGTVSPIWSHFHVPFVEPRPPKWW